MPYKKTLLLSLFTALTLNTLHAASKPVDLSTLDGNWHLRIMDGMEVRKARAIIDFDSKRMKISGFDACNRISGKLIRYTNHSLSTKLRVTRMACRQSIHRYVSRRLQQTLKTGFIITKSQRNGVKGITLKSKKHKLFFGRMGE